MTTQAKNRVLAYIVLAMMAAVMIVGVTNHTEPKPQRSVTFMLPKEKPVLVTVAEQPSLDEAEFECLRMNIYHEAGNQSRRGMQAVALVTINRTKTKHFPSTICGVVTQAVVVNGAIKRNHCQFSWYCDGKDDAPKLVQVVLVKGKRKVVPNLEEQRAWEMAAVVARNAMEGKIEHFLGGATNYHATYCSPAWSKAKRFKLVAQVGIHLFYRDVKLGRKA